MQKLQTSLLVLLCSLATPLLAQAPVDTSKASPPKEKEQLFGSYREYQPLLRTCVAQYDAYAQQLACTKDSIVTMVYANLQWPGPDVCVEGTAFVSFAVEANGELTDFKLLRNPGDGTGEEALRVVKLMAEKTSPWVPAAWGPERKPVRVQYNMPVKFKLE